MVADLIGSVDQAKHRWILKTKSAIVGQKVEVFPAPRYKGPKHFTRARQEGLLVLVLALYISLILLL